MAKTPVRKLKVFQAQIGFYDTVVAAPSMPAALRAWGVRQNLFASGQARITDDEQAVAAALTNPETPLRRVVGTNDPFELDPTGLPTLPAAPERTASVKPAVKSAVAAPKLAPPKPSAPPPDRSQLTEAEAALRRIDEARKIEETQLRQRQAQLDVDCTTAQDGYVETRKQATAAIVEARDRYRTSGGID